MSENNFPKLHNAMWPGLVGKGNEEGEEPPARLMAQPNVIITPHIAARADVPQQFSMNFFCDNLRNLLDGKPIENVVNWERGYKTGRPRDEDGPFWGNKHSSVLGAATRDLAGRRHRLLHAPQRPVHRARANPKTPRHFEHTQPLLLVRSLQLKVPALAT